MIEAAVAMTTTSSEKEAKSIAALLVKEKLAACVQIVSKINSIYRWEGEIHDDQEYLLIIKTRENLTGKVKAAIEKHHSYDVPEFIVLPVIDGAEDYMNWIADSTK